MSKRIDQFPAAGSLTGAELTLVFKDGSTKRVPLSQIAALAALSAAPEGDLDIDMANTDQTVSTAARILTVTSSPPMSAGRALTLDPPPATKGYLIVLTNDAEDIVTVGIGTGTTEPVGAGLSVLLRVTSTGVRNAITGGGP